MERKQEENEKFYQSSRKNDEILFKLKKSAARALFIYQRLYTLFPYCSAIALNFDAPPLECVT